jgi:hypothetical protein
VMQSNPPQHKKNWFLKGLWVWVFGLAGIAIIAFVALTEGRYYAWLLWLAIPYLLISFVAALIVYALPIFLSFGEDGQPEEERSEENRDQ